MNFEVHKFLQDHNFTKSCARPPAIGEENEVTSVDGRMSTHSSVSGKSEVSTATPRRTDIDLGFEPEGSASPLPMCDRWRSALHNVLEDSEGIRLLKMFLADTKQTELIDFYLACKGFRDFGTKNSYSNNSSAASSTTGTITAQMDLATVQNRGKLSRKIFSTYLKKENCAAVSSIIKDVTRQCICKQIKKALQSQKNMSSYFELDTSLFDQAQNEIEVYIEKNCYMSFLNSELLRKYAAQCDSKLTKQSPQVMPVQLQNENKNLSSDASQVSIQPEAAAASSRYLPRLDENQVWHPPFISKSENASIDNDQSLTSSSLAKQAMKRSMAVSQSQYVNSQDGPDQNHPAYAYLVAPSASKYYVPPASANASDNASSDATSDTLSITDGSLDLEPYNSKKHQKRIMRHQMKRNPNMYCPAEKHFISLTRRCHDKLNLATLATDHPREFFSQLKEKLDKVVEERKKKEMMEAAAAENLEDILERHIETVGHMKTPNPIDSPNRNPSPPPMAASGIRSSTQARNPAFTTATSTQAMAERTFRQSQEGVNHSAMSHRPSNLDHAAVPQRRTDSLRRRKEVTVGMSPNEVPDVMEVPAPPVDKNSFISEWIKQQDNAKSVQPQSAGPQPRRGSVSKSGKPSKYINPSDSFPTQAAVTSKANSYHSQPLQPISQDRMMPPLSHPDPRTMLDEVKRRLIQETEERCYADSMRSMGGPVMPPQNPVAHMDSFSGSPMLRGLHSANLNRHESQSGSYAHAPASSSSSGTVTVFNMSRLEGGKTTCIYYMNDEELAYKVQIHHRPVTLGQFKTYLRRKGNFAYFFKQYSREIAGPVYFQIVEDGAILPLWENAVVAKVKRAST